MSNTTSNAFHTSTEGVSKPSVTDYLAEICKEDNVDLNEYLASENATKTIEVKEVFVKHHPLRDALFNPKMTYDWKDRIKSVWFQFKNLKYTRYNLFDFYTYPEYGPHDFVPTSLSTPWSRFKSFIKNQWYEIKWAWDYTPEHIVHYNKNKPRIGWFENKMNKLFFLNWDDKKDQTIKELKEQGYRVEDNRIWHEPIPADEDKRII